LNQVRIQPQAQEEAEQAAVWYETQQTGLGIEFILELDTAVERAAESPEMYAMQYREARRILLRRFPYAVYYIYEDSVVEIFAILHQQRESSLWQSRVP
jgi:plasmid stabilization system protein ParE